MDDSELVLERRGELLVEAPEVQDGGEVESVVEVLGAAEGGHFVLAVIGPVSAREWKSRRGRLPLVAHADDERETDDLAVLQLLHQCFLAWLGGFREHVFNASQVGALIALLGHSGTASNGRRHHGSGSEQGANGAGSGQHDRRAGTHGLREQASA